MKLHERLPAFRAAAGVRLAELSARAEICSRRNPICDRQHALLQMIRALQKSCLRSLEAEGQKEEAQSLANEWLARFPQRYFLLEQIGKPDLQHLADDASGY